MITRWGTSHFVSNENAVAYYYRKGYAGSAQHAVDRKMDAGEIHIGPPKTKMFEGLLVDSDGRYWILEKEVAV